jgi:hypothetical protein
MNCFLCDVSQYSCKSTLIVPASRTYVLQFLLRSVLQCVVINIFERFKFRMRFANRRNICCVDHRHVKYLGLYEHKKEPPFDFIRPKFLSLLVNYIYSIYLLLG